MGLSIYAFQRRRAKHRVSIQLLRPYCKYDHRSGDRPLTRRGLCQPIGERPAQARRQLTDEAVLEAIVYIIFCVPTGFRGVNRRMGFLGTFVPALASTPLLVLPVLFFIGPSRRVECQPRN